MTWDRVATVEQELDRYLDAATPASDRLPPDDPIRPGAGLTVGVARALFEDTGFDFSLDGRVELNGVAGNGPALHPISLIPLACATSGIRRPTNMGGRQ